MCLQSGNYWESDIVAHWETFFRSSTSVYASRFGLKMGSWEEQAYCGALGNCSFSSLTVVPEGLW